MSLPICPKCRSVRVSTGYPLDAGANRCDACGYSGPVVEFHADPFDIPTIDFEVSHRNGGLANLIDPPKQDDKTLKPVIRRTIKPHRELKVHPIPKQWWQD